MQAVQNEQAKYNLHNSCMAYRFKEYKESDAIRMQAERTEALVS